MLPNDAIRCFSHIAAHIICGAALLIHAPRLRGHSESGVALQHLDVLLEAAPADAVLLLRRGQHHASRQRFALAAADYDRAAEIDPCLPGLHRARAGLFLAWDRPEAARYALNRALAVEPGDVEAMILRARAGALLDDVASARADYAEVVRLLSAPPPDLYLAYADIFADPVEALRVLDEGIERIGPAYPLQWRAFQIERRLRRSGAALRRLESIAATSERKETWLKLRGDLLAEAGSRDQAWAAYSAALAEIRALPSTLRSGPDVSALADELARLCDSLADSTFHPPPPAS